jgi:hypothetical protein
MARISDWKVAGASSLRERRDGVATAAVFVVVVGCVMRGTLVTHLTIQPAAWEGEVLAAWHPETQFPRNWVSGFLGGMQSLLFSGLEPKPSFPVRFCTFFFNHEQNILATPLISFICLIINARNLHINATFLHFPQRGMTAVQCVAFRMVPGREPGVGCVLLSLIVRREAEIIGNVASAASG